MFFDKNFRGFIPELPSIEIAIDIPRESIPDNGITFIMCHPNPMEGGTMDNKVVTTVIKSMNKLGLVSVRFNFRPDGQEALDYLKAVIHWVKKYRPGPIWLGGFSFGSYVAYACANDSGFNIAQLLTIAPAVNRWDYMALPAPKMPWVCVIGDQDEVVPCADVFNFIQQVPCSVNLIKFYQTGHFFHQKLVLLDNALKNYYAPIVGADPCVCP